MPTLESPNSSAADPLAALDARLARMERSVERLSRAVEALPGLVAMAGDSADETIARIEGQTGVLTEDRVAAVERTLIRLSDPRTLEALHRALDLAESAEGTVGLALDAADAWVAGLQTDDQDPEQRIASAARLAERLTEPRTLRLAHKVLDRAGHLEQLLDVALATPDTVGMILDVTDELLRRAEEEGLELDLLLDRTVQVALRAGRLAGSDELQELIDSSVLDTGALRTVSLAANALSETRAEPSGRAGFFGALGALNDPHIQAALDFAIRFGRRFGAALSQPADLPVPR